MAGMENSITKACKLMEKRKYSKASELFTKILQAEPRNGMALNLNALCHVRMEKYKDAILLFNKAIKAHPRDPFAYGEKAKTLFLMNQAKKSLPVFNKAIKLSEDGKYKAKLVCSAAVAHFLLDKNKKGHSLLNEAYSIDPGETASSLKIIYNNISTKLKFPRSRKAAFEKSIGLLGKKG